MNKKRYACASTGIKIDGPTIYSVTVPFVVEANNHYEAVGIATACGDRWAELHEDEYSGYTWKTLVASQPDYALTSPSEIRKNDNG